MLGLDDNSLSMLDAAFVYLEREGMPLSVASVNIFDGIVPLEECRAFIDSKLDLIPRYLQRVVTPPFHLGLPSWQFDTNFDIRNHVNEVRLKRGTEAELKQVVSKILSTNMDRRIPLWDFFLLRGMKDNCTPIITRVHHCLADGVSGVDLLKVVLDAKPTTAPPRRKRRRHFRPPPPPASLADSLMNAFSFGIERALEAQSELVNFAQQFLAEEKEPSDGSASKNDAAGSPSAHQVDINSHSDGFSAADFLRYLPELVGATERLPFNLVYQGPQKYNWAALPLDQIKAVKRACGVTVNDVVLTVVTDTIRGYAQLHGIDIKGRLLRIVVPVSIRGKSAAGALGNRVTFFPVNIPMDIDDPRQLLAVVHQRVAVARGARLPELIGLTGMLLATVPTFVYGALGPLASYLPLCLCNLICTNVPGPQMPLYLLDHKMLACYPYVPIGGEMGLNIAVVTYNGVAHFGFSAEVHAVPDADRLSKLLTTSFSELRKAVGVPAARTRRARPEPEPAPVSVQPAVSGPAIVSLEAPLAGVAAQPAVPEAATVSTETVPTEPAKARGAAA